jgi:hypothetical protein
MQVISIKEEARRLVEKLPNSSTWDDLMYEIYVRQAVEEGLKDSRAGRTTDVKEVRKKFGLPISTYIGPITQSVIFPLFTIT